MFLFWKITIFGDFLKHSRETRETRRGLLGARAAIADAVALRGAGLKEERHHALQLVAGS